VRRVVEQKEEEIYKEIEGRLQRKKKKRDYECYERERREREIEKGDRDT
jgi:hypothetical protein